MSANFDKWRNPIAAPSSTIAVGAPPIPIATDITVDGVTDQISLPLGQEYNVYGYGEFDGATVNVEWTLAKIGGTWTAVTSGTAQNIRGVRFLNNAYIYTANMGVIHTSPDGIVWTNSPTGQPLAFLDVAFGEGLYVVVGSVGATLTSPDLVVWTLEPAIIGVQLNSIVFAKGQFVACGFDSNILTSPDGIGWTIQSSPIPTTIFESIAFGNGLYVIVGSGSAILTSPDGINWTQRNKPANMATMQLFSVTFDGERFLLTGGLSSPTGGNIATSLDGINWFLSGAGIPNVSLRCSDFSFDTYLVGGNDGFLFTSPDAVEWTQQVSATVNNINAITGGSDKIVLVANSGDISVTGVEWTPLKDADGTLVTFTAQDVFNVPRIGAGVHLRTNTSGSGANTNVNVDLR